MFFAWNVRGLNSDRRHTMVKEWINIHIPLFGAYLETRIQPNNPRRISSALPFGWKYISNAEHHGNARIIVVWHPSVTVTVYQASSQAITCGIFISAENINFTVTFIYAKNLTEDRQELWRELAHLNSTTPLARSP